jgi:hypothetical protein
VSAVCDTYAIAQAIEEEGVHVVSTDEKTGMQALERVAPKKPARPGLTERIESEYKRHGTLCLIANFMVATGRVEAATIGPTRTEKDFVAHVAQTIDTDPDGGWVWVADQLNTHKSESLVVLASQRSSESRARAGFSRAWRPARHSSKTQPTEFASSTRQNTVLG